MLGQKGTLKDIQQHVTIMVGLAKSRRTKSYRLKKKTKKKNSFKQIE